MENNELKEIVIATLDTEKGLYIVAKDAMNFDELEIHYTDRYAPTIEYLLRMLRKAFGWMEKDRGKKETTNTRCIHSVNGFCREPSISKTENRKCTETIRMSCKKYKQKYKDPMLVNYVIIEKAGGIRNM